MIFIIFVLIKSQNKSIKNTDMKKISILVPEESVLASVDDPRMLFSAVNQFLVSTGQAPKFEISLVSTKKEIRLHDGTYTIHIHKLLDEVEKCDLVFIPALAGDMQYSLSKNQELIPWIQKQHANGAEIVSLCVGAFLLAATGLLDGKQCSTHWIHSNTFRKMFPKVELVDDKIITEDQGIYTSGGANSYWNLLLYLVEKNINRDMAILVSKYFAIQIERTSQSPFIIFQGQNEHSDELIKKAQTIIEKNFAQKINVEQLSEQLALSRRSLERRFKKATNNTLIEYIQRVKIEAAKKNFESSYKNVHEVMYEVGYTDIKAFRDVFKKVTGMTPYNYRNKYRREAIPTT
jgi:transcriptional regulator GlxA family with amidase domain